MDERRVLWTRDGRERRHSNMTAFKSVSLNLVPLELDTWLMDYICCWPLLSSFSCLGPFARANTFYISSIHTYICARPLATYLSTPRYLSVACFFLRIIPLVLCITPFGVAIKSDCQSYYRLRAKCATTAAARATTRPRCRFDRDRMAVATHGSRDRGMRQALRCWQWSSCCHLPAHSKRKPHGQPLNGQTAYGSIMLPPDHHTHIFLSRAKIAQTNVLISHIMILGLSDSRCHRAAVSGVVLGTGTYCVAAIRRQRVG